jgi:hypothetical protein
VFTWDLAGSIRDNGRVTEYSEVNDVAFQLPNCRPSVRNFAW